MTPAALALMERLRADRRFWAEVAQDQDEHRATQVQAQARRDLLDSLLQMLPRDIEAIEQDAITGVDARIAETEQALGWVA